MYESKNHPLISRGAFAVRMAKHLLAVLLIIAASVLLVVLGYWHVEGLSWASAFMHTCCLPGGYGDLASPQSVSGQVFLGFYGVYANVVFIAALGVSMTPVVHRLLH